MATFSITVQNVTVASYALFTDAKDAQESAANVNKIVIDPVGYYQAIEVTSLAKLLGYIVARPAEVELMAKILTQQKQMYEFFIVS